eukprot:Pgem_evm1s17368
MEEESLYHEVTSVVKGKQKSGVPKPPDYLPPPPPPDCDIPIQKRARSNTTSTRMSSNMLMNPLLDRLLPATPANIKERSMTVDNSQFKPHGKQLEGTYASTDEVSYEIVNHNKKKQKHQSLDSVLSKNMPVPGKQKRSRSHTISTASPRNDVLFDRRAGFRKEVRKKDSREVSGDIAIKNTNSSFEMCDSTNDIVCNLSATNVPENTFSRKFISDLTSRNSFTSLSAEQLKGVSNKKLSTSLDFIDHKLNKELDFVPGPVPGFLPPPPVPTVALSSKVYDDVSALQSLSKSLASETKEEEEEEEDYYIPLGTLKGIKLVNDSLDAELQNNKVDALNSVYDASLTNSSTQHKVPELNKSFPVKVGSDKRSDYYIKVQDLVNIMKSLKGPRTDIIHSQRANEEKGDLPGTGSNDDLYVYYKTDKGSILNVDIDFEGEGKIEFDSIYSEFSELTDSAKDDDYELYAEVKSVSSENFVGKQDII